VEPTYQFFSFLPPLLSLSSLTRRPSHGHGSVCSGGAPRASFVTMAAEVACTPTGKPMQRRWRCWSLLIPTSPADHSPPSSISHLPLPSPVLLESDYCRALACFFPNFGEPTLLQLQQALVRLLSRSSRACVWHSSHRGCPRLLDFGGARRARILGEYSHVGRPRPWWPPNQTSLILEPFHPIPSRPSIQTPP
jgi:hypothetical protein